MSLGFSLGDDVGALLETSNILVLLTQNDEGHEKLRLVVTHLRKNLKTLAKLSEDKESIAWSVLKSTLQAHDGVLQAAFENLRNAHQILSTKQTWQEALESAISGSHRLSRRGRKLRKLASKLEEQNLKLRPYLNVVQSLSWVPLSLDFLYS